MSSHLSSQDIEEGYYAGNSLLPVTYPAAVDSSPSATPFLIQPSPAPSGSQNTSWVAPAPFQSFADDTSFLYPTYNNPSSIAPSTVSPQVSPAPSAVHSPSFSAASTVSSLSNMHSPPVYDNLFFGMNNYQMNAVPEMNTSEDVDPNMPLLGWDSLPGVMNAADAQLMPSQLDSWFLPFETCEYETPKAPLFPQAPAYQCETSKPYSTPIRPAAPITSMPQPMPTYQQTTPVQYRKRRRASSDSPVARRTKRCTTASGEGVREKGRCPYPGCGRSFKDLKAHMLTHQSERPEKCPLVGCEYHFKGFARKYDKNRHTLTHYRGTMVCGFCPGAGTAAETSFDRTDAFKKHLISAHKVEQTAPNCRKRSPSALEPGSRGDLEQYCPGATGKCSTCSGVYGNAQDFYEHLDECVLKAVFPVDSSEDVNARHLTDISKDEAVKETLRRNGLYDEVSPRVATSTTYQPEQNGYDSEGSNAGNLYSVPNHADSLSVNTTATLPLSTTSSSRKPRINYPPVWSVPASDLTKKRRILNVFDGPRRLGREEMMMDNNYEVRIKLPQTDERGRERYVTDLDVASLRRSEALLNATDEEKGPWIPDSMNDRGLIGPSAVGLLPPQQYDH